MKTLCSEGFYTIWYKNLRYRGFSFKKDQKPSLLKVFGLF